MPFVNQQTTIFSKTVLFKIRYPCIFLAVPFYGWPLASVKIAVVRDYFVDLSEPFYRHDRTNIKCGLPF